MSVISHDDRNVHPANTGWLLAKVESTDVIRDATGRYQVWVASADYDHAPVDYTDGINALMRPSVNGRGDWTPPLVRPKRNAQVEGEVELTAAGREVLDRLRMKAARSSRMKAAREAAKAPAVVFQAA